MTTATTTQTREAYYVRENSQQEWKLIKQEELTYFLASNWAVELRFIAPDGTAKKHTIGKGRDVNSAKSPHHDHKIGSFAYNNDGVYSVKYGKTLSSKKKSVTVKGADLYQKLRSLLADGNKGLLVDDCAIRPYHLGEETKIENVRKHEVDPVVNPELKTVSRAAASGAWRIESYQERDWTWFTLHYNGKELTKYAEVFDLIPEWGKKMKEDLSTRGLGYSNKRNAWKLETHVSLEDLEAFFSMYTNPLTPIADDPKTAKIVAEAAKFNGEAGDVVTVVKIQAQPETVQAATVKPTVATVNPAIAEIDAKIDALKVALSLVGADTAIEIQAKINSLNVAKIALS